MTVAGLLMFGKDLAIRDPHGLPEYFVDYREKLDPQLRWTDRLFPDGTWEANLFQFYQRVWPKLAAGLPVPFRLEGGIRRDETPAHVALREALVNAIVHADYTASGGIVLERYPDRFVFDNPGLLMVSWEQFRKGGISSCRNKSLQRMFLMIGGGEQAGSGADKIREGWKSNHWRPPLMSRTFDPDRIHLVLPMASLIPDTTLRTLRALFGSRLDGLSSDELQALATAELEGSVSNGRLQEVLTRHPVDISRMLQSLCERGYLISDNRRRWATYQLALGSAGPSLFDGPGDSTQSAGDFPQSAGDFPHSGGGAIPQKPNFEIRLRHH
ncbi:MAG TPA: ATP-binding protein [Fibrobacteria bacterium]|nr:ATP-binding protein [Fibrobacteria bacterium]